MELMCSNQNNLFTSALLATKYYMTYVDRKEDRTPAQSGSGWTMEMINTIGESHRTF
jgi:hypothetical protein